MEILSTLQSIAKAIEKAIPGTKCHCYALEIQILCTHPKFPEGIHALIPFYQIAIRKGNFTEEMQTEILNELHKLVS